MRMTTAMAALFLVCDPAHAEWVSTKGNDDPFKGGAEYVALAIEGLGKGMAAFRCTRKLDLTLMLVTTEKPTNEVLRRLDEFRDVKILVIVDDDPRIVLPATLGATPDNERLRFEAQGSTVATVLHAAAAAKRRFAIAAELNGKIVTSESFGINGSRRALAPLIEGCSIPERKGS